MQAAVALTHKFGYSAPSIGRRMSAVGDELHRRNIY
jgi:hypothetical protein